MGNRYFSQYLLNIGVLSDKNVDMVMSKSIDAVPQLPLLAVQHQYLSEDQLTKLLEADNASEALKTDGILSESQLDSLKNMAPGRDAYIAQALLDVGICNLRELDKLYKEYEALDEKPIQVAVNALVAKYDDMNPVEEIYGEYAEMFIGALQRFMNTDAVIMPEPAVPELTGTHIVSQSMGGEISLAVAVMAEDDIFLEMAKRYSGEDMTQVDTMAEDSLAEFINVLNGLYIVNLSGKDYDMDLDLPRSFQNVKPMASSMIAMRIVTVFGSFIVFLAEDDFLY
ncbi:MAG: chemotaxis protein CheX [Anaerovibrio sp.]|uniref:chemotaxis protein CheX n=1 Tax=Anaerovibrio sp. TaxID=1872532 RepID=UPI0025FDFDD6|nr:chemotaxis protein CheX [Anaerovibrio sp.]MCR5177060.1 chemotaxis protein CheX [Anaerovibrio sp.]